MPNISEFDVFFLSFDEPNCEKHFAHLVDQCPWAKRVHGVKGFDAAHRACAERSETDWFVTVDADNTVLPEFFDEEVELGGNPLQCYSWNGLNMINGLMYGNGGLKLWSKQFVLNMNTHENADDPRKAVDFCWEDNYTQVNKTFSYVWNNASAYQAFRVGFREAVKLSLDRGERVPPEEMRTRLHNVNLRNLRIWSCVGADVDKGKYAMWGTRLGLWYMCDMGWDHTQIRDYDWFKDFWNSNVVAKCDSSPTVDERIWALGAELEGMTHISFPYLDAAASHFFRESFKLRNE